MNAPAHPKTLLQMRGVAIPAARLSDSALVVIDAISRLIPGVVGDEQSVEQDSFAGGVLDYPHYTRPAEFAGLKVPDVLLSGHHAEVRRWRRKTALARTLERRPDLLNDAALDDDDRALLKEIREGRGESDECD